jgi:hypothetical protein
MALWQRGNRDEARATFHHGSDWLKGYEQSCQERKKQNITTFPIPSMLRRLQSEAATLLGVMESETQAVSPNADPPRQPTELIELPVQDAKVPEPDVNGAVP